MQNSVAKKVFAVGIAASTVLMTLAPLAAQAAVHAAGTNVKSSDGTIYMITTDGQRRPYTSAGAFLSYGFNSFASTVDASAEDLALPVGSFIAPQDGTIFCATETKASDVKGECSLITGGLKASFTSAAVFTGLGFTFTNAQYGDSSFLTKTSNVDNTTAAHLPGVLVNNNGTVQLMGTSGLLGIPDLATFNSWGYSFKNVVPANAADKALTQTGVMAARVAGQLSPSFTTGGTTPPATGSASVSLASGNPAGATVPSKATNVPVLKFNVTAGSAAATLTNLAVKRTGVGNRSDVANLYLYDGETRLTTGRTISSESDKASFSGLNVTVPAGSTKTLTVVMDMATSPTTGDVHSFGIAANSDVVLSGGGTVTGAPVNGNSFTVGGQSVGTLTVTLASSPSLTPSLNAVGAELARWQFAATTEDIAVSRLTVTQGGNLATTGLTNLKAKVGSTEVATGVYAGGSLYVFTFPTPYVITKGNNKIVTLVGDISGKKSDTSLLYIDETTDLKAIGQTYGYGVAITDTAIDDSTDSTQTLTLSGGKVTITFNGPVAGTVGTSQQDIVFLDFTITATEQVDVKRLEINLEAVGAAAGLYDDADSSETWTSGDTAYFTDIKIKDKDTGVTVMGPKELSDGTITVSTNDDAGLLDDFKIDFTDTFTMTAGQTRHMLITADSASSMPTGTTATYRADLDLSTSDTSVTEVRNTQNTTVTDIVPATNLTGNLMTGNAASLDITLAPSPAAQNVVKGSTVDLAAFNLKAGQASLVKMTQLKFTGYANTDDTTYTDIAQYNEAGDSNAQDLISSIELYVGTEKIAGPVSFNSSEAANFTSSDFVGGSYSIPAGATKTVTVKGVLGKTLPASSHDGVAVDIATTGTGAATAPDMTLEDKDGNTVEGNDNDSDLTDAFVAPNATPTVYMTVNSAGTLNVTTASDRPDAALITAGSSDVPLHKLKFTSNYEAFNVNKLEFDETSTFDDNFTGFYVKYPKADGTEGTTTGTISAGTLDFTGLEMYVPKDTDKTLTLYGNLSTVANGADSGDKPLFTFDANANFEAVGVGSSNTLTQSSDNTDREGQTMIVVQNKPTVSTATYTANTIPGNGEVYRFTVAASGDKTLYLKQVVFKVNSTDNGGESDPDWNECDTDAASGLVAADFNLYKVVSGAVDTSNALGTATALKATGAACDTSATDIGFVRFVLSTAEEVAAGSSKTYSLYADTTGASSANDDSFRIDIVSEPIVSTFLASTTINEGALYSATDVTLTVTDGTQFAAGDLLKIENEYLLVSAVATNDLTVVRAVNGSTAATHADGTAITRMPGSFVWSDTSSTPDKDGYLVKNLTVTGNNIVY